VVEDIGNTPKRARPIGKNREVYCFKTKRRGGKTGGTKKSAIHGE